MRTIKHIHGNKPSHWVGDGFCVQTLMTHLNENADFNYSHTDPFLLFDYSPPKTFAPNPHYDTHPYGVAQHPHKGFETVTIAYSGEISHADSAGGNGTILTGDAQWMTAGRGIMHEEFHSLTFGQHGGVLSMAQLWINLPQAHKLTAPNYQALKRNDMPVLELTSCQNACCDDSEQTVIGTITLIAGSYQGLTGAAQTFTSINVWDIELTEAGATMLEIPNSHTVMILVREGELLINDTIVNAGKLVQFTAPTEYADADAIKLSWPGDLIKTNDKSTPIPAKLLLLSGQPIGEPIAGYGPFVMTTADELKQTLHDYQTGNFV